NPKLAGFDQVLGRIVAEYLERPLHARPGRDRGARTSPEVGVVEIRQAVGGAPDGAPDPALLPGEHAVVGAQPGQHRTDRVPVPDPHAVDTSHVARLRLDPKPPGGADHRQRRLRPRAGELKRHRPAWLGQRAVRQEGAAPGGLAVAGTPGNDLPRQPADWPAAHVDEAGLPGQAVAILADPDHVPVALAQAAWREHDQLGRMPEYLDDVLAQPAGRRPGVELGLDHDAAIGQVQPAGEPEQRGYLGLAAARLEHADAAELVLDQAGQRHQSHSPSNIRASAPASSSGSCRSGRPAAAMSASMSRALSKSVASFSSATVSRTAAWSASTTSIARSGA